MSVSSHSRPRIGVDLLLLSQFSDTGMVTYSAEILPRLFRAMPECDWILFSKRGVTLPFEIAEFSNVKIVHSVWMRSPWPWKLAGVIVEPLLHRLDALFLPMSRVQLVKTCKQIVFVHDLGFLSMPEFLGAGTLKPTQVAMRQVARSADTLLTNSTFSKKEFCRYYGTPESKIQVTYLGYDEKLFNVAPVPSGRIGATLERYGIRNPYVLYLGVIQGRKNLTALIAAAKRWSARRSDLQLVLAGKRGWNCDDIYEAAEEVPELVRMTGRIESEDLPLLYANARCFVLPSFYEGFGMPVIESMACGTPNVLSNRGALPEVGGSAALYFDPYDVAEISESILRVVEDDGLRKTLREAGLARSRSFTWEAVGAATVSAFRRTLALKMEAPEGSTGLDSIQG